MIDVSISLNNDDFSKKEGKSSNGPNSSSPISASRWDHENPQFEVWTVDSVVEPGIYNLIRPGSSTVMRSVESIGQQPGNVEAGDSVLVGFYNSDRTRPYIIDNSSDAVESEEVIEKFPNDGWQALYADFSRSNNRFDVEFDYTDIISAGTSNHTRSQGLSRVRDVGDQCIMPRTPGSPFLESYSYTDPEILDILGLLDGSYEDDYELEYPLGPNDEREHAVTYADSFNICSVDGLTYINVEYEIESTTTYDVGEEEEYEESEYAYEYLILVFYALPQLDGFYQIKLKWHMFDVAGMDDLIVTNGRLVIIDYPGYLRHYDASIGGNEQIIDYESSLQLVGEVGIGHIGGPTTFAQGEHVWIGGSGVGISCVNLDTNSLVWTQSSDKTYHPFGFADNSLLCVYNETDTEVITDYFYYPHVWDAALNPEPRLPEVARGHSERAGVVALNKYSGAEVGQTMFSGTEPNGQLTESIVDYFKDLATIETPRLPNPNSTGPPGGGYEWNNTRHCGGWTRPSIQSFRNYYVGFLTEETYQDTNESGTRIEGPLLGDYGDYSGMKGTPVVPGPNYCTYAWQGDNAQAAADIINGINQRADPDPPGSPEELSELEEFAKKIEQGNKLPTESFTRNNNGDWITFEAVKLELEAAVFDDVPIDTVPPVGSRNVENVTFFESRRYAFGITSEPPTLISVPGGVQYTQFGRAGSPASPGNVSTAFIPYPTPPAGEDHPGWDVTYRIQHKAWSDAGGNPGDEPDPGLRTYGFDGPNPAGITTITQTFRQFWRPFPTVVDRERSVAPHTMFGPSTNDGELVIVGPSNNTGATDMTWTAYNSSASVEWSTTVAKFGFAGHNPVAMNIPGGLVGIFTWYNFAGANYILVLESKTGSILHDAVAPIVSGTPTNGITFYIGPKFSSTGGGHVTTNALSP